MSIGKFDTDSKALEIRLETQQKLGTYELNDWIFEALELFSGATVLDLGCGTGKQSLQIAEIIGSLGLVISMDISEESLAKIEKKAKEAKLNNRIQTVIGDMDYLPDRVTENRYDRIVASYSIYYVKEPEPLFKRLEKLLNPGGILFLCGPRHTNNWEIRSLIAKVKSSGEPEPTTPSIFMETKAPKIVSALFDEIKVSEFDNPISFDSEVSLFKYWSSHNLYDSALDMAFRVEAKACFEGNGIFQNVKRAIGIKVTKSK